MRQEERISIDTRTAEGYMSSALHNITEQLEFFYGSLDGITMEKVKADQEKINAYPNLNNLTRIEEDQIVVLDEAAIETTYAEEAILQGKFFWEHAAAGEATRLGLGTKYVIDMSAFTLESIKDLIVREAMEDVKKGSADKSHLAATKRSVSKARLLELCGGTPSDLMPLSLGTRHMLQMAFDVRRIAKKHKKDPDKSLRNQKTLIILNEETEKQIIAEFETYRFFGLDPMNVLFMVQKKFHGISIDGRALFFDTKKDNRRLHNHGQMMMQKAHERSIFRVVGGKKTYLQESEFERILASCLDLLSYNIEDIDYLTNAIDLPSLSLSLNLGKKGYDMVMEIVAQNPYRPQKGGAAFYDPQERRNVMIESNRLRGMKESDIKHLNRNFNHYPNPVNSFRRMKTSGLPLPFEVKKASDGNDYIYPCPVQGDMNFLVRTAFVMRKDLRPINNWKSAATTPPTVKAFFAQEAQDGFIDFAKSIR